MSGTLPANPPATERVASGSIELVITARTRDLGGFEVRRVLPSAQRRLIGPFIFFDQMGPAALPVGAGLDVRPHPHIALATVTYLFEGEIIHRDSLGSQQAIRPGDVNWMVPGAELPTPSGAVRSSGRPVRACSAFRAGLPCPWRWRSVHRPFSTTLRAPSRSWSKVARGWM